MSLNDQGFNQFYTLFKMKKSILNLGKALNKIEQKSINGGDGILPTTGDPRCENVTETQYIEHCGCYTSTQCGNMTVPASDGNGYVLRSGQCINNRCVA